MGDFGGGIPSQIVSELSSIPKQAVKDTAKAFGDIAVGTAEKVATGGTTKPNSQAVGPVSGNENNPGNDPMVAMKAQKDAAAKKRLSEVRAELQEYYEQQKKKKEQEEVIAEEKEKQEEQKTKSKKKQEEQEVLHRLSTQYGGTGEVAKSGN